MSKVLLKAAASGQNEKLLSLLDGGADIDFVDKMPGRTALIEAAIAGHAHTVNVLIARGASLDKTDQTLGFTALGWAADQGNLQIVDALLVAQAAVDLTAYEYQQTPLMIAAREGHADVVAALLAAGANVHVQTGIGDNALSMAGARNHAEIVALLQQHGALAPIAPEEYSMPWPGVAADLSDVDDSNPASVLRGFILAMHRWETDCYNQQQRLDDGELDWVVIQQAQNQIFERFCTPKPRTYGRLGSFGFPPEYTPEDALVSIEPEARRTAIMTRQAPSTRSRYEVLFGLTRKGNIWRIDTKKKRPWGTAADWERSIV
ncbi:ankyrin repeat domain-containing protein [Pseudomonas sp.]|uniref:ankyrin repeat domain-containing protein n=1 Tax=Pseudomonas sp. TaxID=306 RepID=UPI00263999E7|nr:ankyrin repeat domain-containing protein [Pseudomonas sp.]